MKAFILPLLLIFIHISASVIGQDLTEVDSIPSTLKESLCDRAVDPFQKTDYTGHSLSAFEEIIFAAVLGYNLEGKTDDFFESHADEFRRVFDVQVSEILCEATVRFKKEPVMMRLLGDTRNVSIVGALVKGYEIDINKLYGPPGKQATALDWLIYFRDHPGKNAGPQEKYQMWIDKYFNEKTGAKTAAQVLAERDATSSDNE